MIITDIVTSASTLEDSKETFLSRMKLRRFEVVGEVIAHWQLNLFTDDADVILYAEVRKL